jgi:P pilus assembly chaperone PapD
MDNILYRGMKSILRPHQFVFCGMFALTSFSSVESHAGGPLPETSVVLIREADEGGSIKVTNTDPTPVLLTTTIENIAEDPEDIVVASPPIARLEPGETQLIRFLLTSPESLKAQRLKRVIFEGIPEVNRENNTVQMSVRQNLPLLVLPKDLAEERAPWTKLRWYLKSDGIEVENASPYVVRIDQTAQVLPTAQNVTLPKPYILPGETLPVKIPSALDMTGVTGIRLFPATVYGYMVNSYDAPIR